MFERYLQMLDNFKENDIARLLKGSREKILASLQRPYFSERVRPFFIKFDTKGEPFSDFANEPKQIVQIKQLINALYHAQLAFEDLQSVNLRNKSQSLQDFRKLYYKTIEHGYQACYLLTHLDIDLIEIFGSEIYQQGLDILALIKSYADEHENRAIEITAALKAYPIGYNAGWASGVAIDQMQPNGGNFDYDYDFLAQFGAVLPGYIQQWTLELKKFAPNIGIADLQPKIDQQKLKELQEASFKLLKSVENLQSGDIFVSFRALNYIHIVRHIFTLSMSTLEQIGYMSESSQKVVRHNLSLLKYTYLPTLFTLIDRIEDQSLLTPGTLSKPLMDQIKPWYELLGMYASKIVDFSAGQEELLDIEDARFVNLRLKQTRERVADSKWQLIKLKLAQEAFETFFKIIEDSKFKNYSFLSLPAETKMILAREYKFLHTYLKALDPALAASLVKDLTEENTYTRQLVSRPWDWVWRQAGPLPLSKIVELKERLQSQLNKDFWTQTLHIQLNEDILSSISKSNISIFPQNTIEEITLNEAKLLGLNTDENPPKGCTVAQGHILVTDYSVLSANQANKLYIHYEIQCSILTATVEAWNEFAQYIAKDPLLTNIPDAATKEQLRRLYSLCQPYFLQVFEDKALAMEQDKAIIALLSDQPLLSAKGVKLLVSPLCFAGRIDTVRAVLNSLLELSSNRLFTFKERTKEKYILGMETQPIASEPFNSRANHVLKHTEYSKGIAAYRASLYNLTEAFNNSFKKKFKPATKGIPFPIVMDKKKALLESKQVIGIKRIFNSLYFLEQIFLELEKLDQNGTQSLYVYHLIQAKGHFQELFELAKELAVDPHFSLLATELKEKALMMYGQFIQQKENYARGSEDIHLQPHLPTDEKTVKYSSLWYSLHAFMLVPEHINAALSQRELSSETKEAIGKRTKQAVVNIERIIEDSSSYFKLFLDTPTMYSLYKELKQKLKDFTDISHSAALAHIEELNTDLFCRILVETDKWEEKLGFRPGLLADPMKALLDEFYKGLLEPLELGSQEHIALIGSLNPIFSRMEDCQKRKKEAIEKLLPTESLEIKNQDLENALYRFPHISFQDRFYVIQNLLAEMTAYNNLKSGPEVIKTLAEERLKKLLRIALPILLSVKKELGLSAEPIDKNDEGVENFMQTVLPEFLDEASNLINSSSNQESQPKEMPRGGLSAIIESVISSVLPSSEDLKTTENKSKDEPQLTSIVKLTGTILMHYRGLNNSAKFEIETTDERMQYLHNLKVKQLHQTYQFIKTYTLNAYEQQFQVTTSRYIGLILTRDEYKQALQAYLLSFKPMFLEQAQAALDIDGEIEHLIEEKTKEFAHENFKKYHQLEAISAALAEFDIYFSKTQSGQVRGGTFFESEKTLQKKIEIIDQLKTIAKSQEPLEERLRKIKEQVEKTSFKSKMLAHHHYDTLTFSWVLQWVVSLLTTLGIYTPKDKIITERLSQAVSNPPNPNASLHHFGLFRHGNNSGRSYEVPNPPSIDAPENPIPNV